jgi:anaerobic selenocysteine-containing dehydrogenase
MSRHQNLAIHLVMTLNALCGRYDRPGGLVRNEGPLGFEIPPGMGPLPLALESGQASRIRGIKGIFNVLGGFTELPSNTLTDEILTPGEGQIRALFVVGGNPALVLPDEQSTVRALKDLDLLVVNDLFMSATAKFADYVFGVRHPFERPDVTRLADIAFPFPFGQYSPALVDPPEGVLEDWEVFWALAHRLDLDLNIPNLSMDSRPTADALMDGLQPMKRISLQEIKEVPGGRVWGERELKAGGLIPSMIGHEDKKMAVGHPEVLEHLRELRAEPVLEGGGYEPNEDRRFRLIGYRMQESYCTQGQNLPSLMAKRPFNPLLMHPKGMEAIGVQGDDTVVVDSGFGTVEAIVESTEDVQPDVVALAFGWGDPSDKHSVRKKGSNVQRLIPDDVRYDPVTGLAQTTAIPVNIRPKESS